MELIILNDGLYQLVPVTKEILKGIEIISEALVLTSAIFLDSNLQDM